MLVKELILRLQEMPGDAIVEVYKEVSCGYATMVERSAVDDLVLYDYSSEKWKDCPTFGKKFVFLDPV